MLGFDRETRPKDRTAIDQSLVSINTDGEAETQVSPRDRSKVTARPVTNVDSQVVERATWMMKALTVLDDPLEIEAREPGERGLVAYDEPSGPVTVVTGDATNHFRALPPTPPKRTKRHWMAGLVTLTLVAVLVGTALTVVTPLARGETGGLAVGGAGPLGLPVAFEQANQAPTGHWVAVIGAQPASQDIGGGAGPGVSAPGSAGLSVSSVHLTLNKTTAAAPATTSSYSAAPFSPWPPASQWVTVPGYYSFTVYGSGGYYSWAFGQCTWWAQDQRRDENLMHMGNAQFWAIGARSRGYTVSSVPRPGSTVVFQPGVEGAGGAGHVAHVVKVYPNGWFLIAEMNFYWNGGGWGRVDYRLAHTAWGVQFIY